MISDVEAREFAKRNFPEAPEKLAKHLGVIVRESPMGGCDGWCLSTGAKTIIRINSKLSATRQRFTLAHELGHLILGVPTVVGETFEDMLRSDSDEERRVNDLASELLIPTDVVKASLPELPVVAITLKKLAKKANVSELAAAIRVCNLARAIGLVNASVVLVRRRADPLAVVQDTVDAARYRRRPTRQGSKRSPQRLPPSKREGRRYRCIHDRKPFFRIRHALCAIASSTIWHETVAS